MDFPLRIPTELTVGRSGQEAATRVVNGYVEMLGADNDGKSKYVVYPMPGLAAWSTKSYGTASRGMILLDDSHLMALMGSQFVKFETDGSSSVVLNISGSDRVTMARNMNANPQIGMVTDNGTYYLFQNIDAIAATGSVAFTNNPSNGQVLTLASTTITFVTSGATGNQVNIGATIAATLAYLMSFLSSTEDTNLVKLEYELISTTLYLTAVTAGTAGNSLGIVTDVTGATPSAATLEDGAAASTSLTTPDVSAFGAPNSICYLRGKFILTTAAGLIFHSAIDDGATFDALAQDKASSDPDGIVRAVASAGFLYVFGVRSLEIWQDAGTTPFSFAPMQQYIALGLLAKYSVAETDKGLIWVDHKGIVRYGRDGGAQRVSTHSVERAIEQLTAAEKATLNGNYSVANGHEFYSLSSDHWTWVYDFGNQRWTERQSYGETRWIGQESVLFTGRWIINDYRNGLLYALDPDTYSEGGNEFVMELWCPHMHNFANSLIVDAFNLDIITGYGNTEGASADDISPVITVDYSDNGGKVFKGERVASIGKSGDYSRKISLNLWGRCDQKGRIWRVRAPSRVLRGVIQGKLQVRPCK